MQISDHYLGYPKKIFIVVTNNESAKILVAHEREINEMDILKIKTEKPDEKSTGTANSGPPDTDQIKAQARKDLYSKLSKKLLKRLKADDAEIILCAPEANKNEIVDAMHADVMKNIKHVVPKNLASLPLDQIVRILQETRIE